jgi:hypothetical protein
MDETIKRAVEAITERTMGKGNPPRMSDAEIALFQILLTRLGVSSRHYLVMHGVASFLAHYVGADDGAKIVAEVLPNQWQASSIAVMRHMPLMPSESR